MSYLFLLLFGVPLPKSVPLKAPSRRFLAPPSASSKNAPTARNETFGMSSRKQLIAIDVRSSNFARSSLSSRNVLYAQICHPESNTIPRRRRALLRDLPLGALYLLDFGKCETKNYPCQSFSRKRFEKGDSSLRALRPRILCLPLGMTRSVCSSCAT